MIQAFVLIAVLMIAAIIATVAWLRTRAALMALQARMAPILAAEREAARIRQAAETAAAELHQRAERAEAAARQEITAARARIEALHRQHAEDSARLEADRQALRAQYQQGRETYARLQQEVALLEENLEDISFGVYRPHFTFQTSEEYKQALETLWQQEKEMVRSGQAAVCHAQWEVGGNRKDGERMTKQYVKLLLRAFNGECDAAVAKVTWNNIATMEERIRKTFDSLNRLGTVMQMEIRQPYLELKLQELRLAHEQEEKKQQEKEEQRRLREQIREEERVQRELAAAVERAGRDERTAAKALEKARKDAERASGEAEREALASRIRELEAQIAAAQMEHERAIAQAQLTKFGHVYVLSNVGAFGESVVKIGMTRRLDPRERVQELGDASVPFPFDVHALIYTDNAPQLETELHTHFWDKRINLANDRKEFFRVSLDEVGAFITERGLKCEFVRLAEAKEYRQTCADRELARRATAATAAATAPEAFPGELFLGLPETAPPVVSGG